MTEIQNPKQKKSPVGRQGLKIKKQSARAAKASDGFHGRPCKGARILVNP